MSKIAKRNLIKLISNIITVQWTLIGLNIVLSNPTSGLATLIYKLVTIVTNTDNR